MSARGVSTLNLPIAPALSAADFFGWDDPAVLAASAALAFAVAIGLAIIWRNGRDRWLGDAAYLIPGRERIKPPPVT